MSDHQTVAVTPKVWYESKVIWFNALTLVGLFLVLLVQMQDAGTLPFSIDPKWIIFIQAMVNFVLRFVTNAPMTGSKS